jgi:hypothetical protein
MSLLVLGAIVAFGVLVAVLVFMRRSRSSNDTLSRRSRRSNPNRSNRKGANGQGGAGNGRSEIDSAETEDERRLRRLRQFQRAEKVRERQEELEHEHRGVEQQEQQLDEAALRIQRLREFQRAEKVREAAEDLELHGPEVEHEQSIGSLITHNVMDMRHEQEQHKDVVDRAEASRFVGEARDLINDMNAQFGWQYGEASIPDRMFNTDVESVVGEVISTGKIDYRARAMVAAMRSFARAETGGRNELAKVMAARVIMGSAQLSEEESAKLNGAQRLFGDDFAEAEGFADHMSRTEELMEARKLGINASVATERDRGFNRGIGR